MAKGLKTGASVYVPGARVGAPANGSSALVRLRVQAVRGRSIDVSFNGGALVTVPSSAVHKAIGVMILRMGDFESETSLLDPLAKSLLQYCRLLLPDDMIVHREVRSIEEFETFWRSDSAVYSHVILVGHGKKDAMKFGAAWVNAEQLATLFLSGSGERKTLVSLCCETGLAALGKTLSMKSGCHAYIGPFHPVHGAVSSQFCQTFFAYHLLQGETTSVAFRHARRGVPGATSFRLWMGGSMKTDT